MAVKTNKLITDTHLWAGDVFFILQTTKARNSSVVQEASMRVSGWALAAEHAVINFAKIFAAEVHLQALSDLDVGKKKCQYGHSLFIPFLVPKTVMTS